MDQVPVLVSKCHPCDAHYELVHCLENDTKYTCTCMTQWQSPTLSYRHTSNNSLSVRDLEYFNLRQHTSNKLINSRVVLLTCLPWTEWWANSTPIPDMNLVYMELRSVSACCSALVAATSVSLADSPSILNRYRGATEHVESAVVCMSLPWNINCFIFSGFFVC